MQNCVQSVFDTSILSLYMAFIHVLKTGTYSRPFHTCAQSFFLTCILSLYMPFIHVYVLKIRPTAHSHDLITFMHSCISFFLTPILLLYMAIIHVLKTYLHILLVWHDLAALVLNPFFLTRIFSLNMAFVYFTFLWSCYTYALCVSMLKESFVDKRFHMFESHLH